MATILNVGTTTLSISTWIYDLLRPAGPALMALYLLVLAVIVVYGLHRYWLVYLFSKYGRGSLDPDVNHAPGPAASECDDDADNPAGADSRWPAVTVQLPMFNEAAVARRIIEAACRIDYPASKLQIQVLDDSTDHSADISRAVCEEMIQAGHDVQFLHRANRHGYKAGALEAGLKSATGQYIAVFDADFVPNPDILKKTVGYFDDPGIGMVQVRWGHLNRNDSLLTRSQAIFLDGHFIIEHTARYKTGRWFNFNGTAGIWRKTCIDDAGGWEHDTLTEDVDLSYRAQLKGWRFVYDPSIECPAELPPTVTAFQTQQHRWCKGQIQTGLKLLPAIMRSSAPIGTKIEAWFHLTSPIVYVFVVLLSLLFFPAFFIQVSPVQDGTWTALFFGLTLFSLATASAGTFYVASQKAQGRSVLKTIIQLPILMAVGIGISVNNCRAVFEALLNIKSGFVRTPKFAGGNPRQASIDPLARRSQRRWIGPGVIETALGLLMVACIALASVADRTLVSIPFLLLFAGGYLSIGIAGLRDRLIGAA